MKESKKLGSPSLVTQLIDPSRCERSSTSYFKTRRKRKKSKKLSVSRACVKSSDGKKNPREERRNEIFFNIFPSVVNAKVYFTESLLYDLQLSVLLSNCQLRSVVKVR